MTATFRAWWSDGPGIDSLKLEEQPIPEVSDDEVRVRVEVIGLNPVDYKMLGIPLVPNPQVPGVDCSGIVDAVGANVSSVKVGDRVAVHNWIGSKYGTYGQYTVCLPYSVVKIPDDMSFEVAAAIPCPGWTAYEALYYKIHLAEYRGSTIVISGAAGSVGGFAVQFAAKEGLTVIGLARAANHDRVRALGAHHVIDYSTEDVEKRVKELTDGHGAEVWLEAATPENAELAVRSLRYSGQLVSVVGISNSFVLGNYMTRELSVHHISMGFAWAHAEARARLNSWGRATIALVAEHSFDVSIVDILKLEQLVEGVRRVESQRTPGKILVRARD